MRISDWSSDVCSSDLPRQLLRALAFDDLRLQHHVRLLQFAGALVDTALELLARLAAVERGQDVLGDVLQKRAVLVRVARGLQVALDHDRATHAPDRKSVV